MWLLAQEAQAGGQVLDLTQLGVASLLIIGLLGIIRFLLKERAETKIEFTAAIKEERARTDEALARVIEYAPMLAEATKALARSREESR